jgi:hypothetical protein
MESKSAEMSTTETGGKCLFCNTVLQGRSDKKFCNDNCRNFYHNKNKSKSRSSIRKINIILNRNYEILEKLFTDNRKIPIVEEIKFVALNFDFAYSTHSVTDKEGRTVYYCYDFGYYRIQDTYFIVRSD